MTASSTTRLSAIAMVAAGVAACEAMAGDANPPPATRIAAATLLERALALPHEASSDTGDVLLQLAEAESVSPNAVEGATSEDTILAAFPLSAPDGAEDEIARDFKLEIITRLTLKNLGWRIVRYRVPDLRPIDTVVERLRADKRISEAQVNVRYQGLPPKAPEFEVGSVKKLPEEAKEGEKDKRPVALVRKPRDRRDNGEAARRGPTRSAKVTVGDVLSGGF